MHRVRASKVFAVPATSAPKHVLNPCIEPYCFKADLFAGTPTGVASFAIRAQIDDVQADVAAGLDMINSEDSTPRGYYRGHFGDTIEIHSVGLKGSAKF